MFRVNADLTTAMRYWGGGLDAGEEMLVRTGEKAIDLVLTKRGESRRVRLFPNVTVEATPRIALVIDGFGYQAAGQIERYLRLPFAWTPVVLPGRARSTWTVRRCLESGRPPILQLPFEPGDPSHRDPAPGAIPVSMDSVQIGALVEMRLREMDGVIGITQDMGSPGGESAAVVDPVLDRVALHRLFCLDSRTSEGSAWPAEAARKGVRCLSADLFLDGQASPERATMRKHMLEACDLAASSGSSILIGHARPATLDFLESFRDSASLKGCRLVSIVELLR